MKKQAYMIATVIVLWTVAGLSTAQAQSSGAPRLSINIPFEFSVGNKILPAGEYTISCTNPASDLKVLQLRSSDGSASVLVRTNSVIGKTQAAAKLVFNRYDNRHFFAQAWLPGDNSGMQVVKSRTEKQIERELAGTRLHRETVAISAKR
jgi:hypothetical protein